MKRKRNIFDEKHWEDAKDYFPGTKRKILRDENGRRTVLLKLPPGCVIPPHSHITTEQHFVLEGEYVSNGKTYPKGSFQLISPGEQHGSFKSEKGALILIIWDPIKVKNYQSEITTLNDIVSEISKIEHPSVKSSLFDLGIIADIKLNHNKVSLIFAFPPSHLPISYTIINSVTETIRALGFCPIYKIRIMTEAEISRLEGIAGKTKTE